jgi:oxygen-independent coproporphyrinogen-3 oxidase
MTSPPRDTQLAHTPSSDIPLALYIHWPWCQAKCPYCDFNSHVATSIDHQAFAEAYRCEMTHMAARVGRDRPLHSIFFGGGTPSLMPPRLVADTLDTAADLFGFEPDIEITLEANPTSTEAANLEGLAAAGVNRISLGVQSLDAAALAFLGREHSADEALHAIAAARRHFARVSMDLIYARTGQSAQAWMNELQSAIDIGLDHMSLYQLTIEPGTGFYTRTRAGETLVADDDLAADLYQMTDEAMRVAGFDAYEVSNYARAGAACRHNLVYWRAQDWIGVGPGAHGRLTDGPDRIGLATRRSPEGWLADVKKNGHGIETETRDTGQAVIAEHLMMGLRLAEGVDLAALARRIGYDDSTINAASLVDPSALARLSDLSLLDRPSDTRLVATPQGRLVLNSIIAALVPDDDPQ